MTDCLWANLSFTLDSTGSYDIGRLLHGFPASPSLGTQVTSATFYALANVLDLKELFIRDVIICKVAGKLSLSIPAGGGHGGALNTATPQKKINEHRITARKVDGTPSPQQLFSAT